MIKLYKITRESGDTYHATEGEGLATLTAMVSSGDIAKDSARVEPVEFDEIEIREYAAKWLSWCAKRKSMALKREANKTPEQRSEIMRKAWAKRKSDAKANSETLGSEN